MLLMLNRGNTRPVGFLVQNSPPVMRELATGHLLRIDSDEEIIALDEGRPEFGDVVAATEGRSCIQVFGRFSIISGKIYRCLLTDGDFPGILHGSDLEGGLENVATSRNRRLSAVSYSA